MDNQAAMLVNKVKHYLITMMGVTEDEASDAEFFRAFCLTLREEIMINWTATTHSYRQNNARTVHYLCMEYMPGKLLASNLQNMHATTLVQEVLHKMGRSFSVETHLDPELGLGNGGLGRLASCFLDSLATRQYPAVAYGLRYQYGIFEQEIWQGEQVERPDPWLLHENPWEFKRDDHARTVHYAGTPIKTTNAQGTDIFELLDHEEVRALAYDIPIVGYKESSDFNVMTLRLWSTKESPRNFLLQRYNAGHLDQAAENTSITDVLYPNDNNEVGKRIRLKQEFLLASASAQDIIYHHVKHYPDLTSLADKVRIQINDTHPALVIAELMRILMQHHDFSWHDAWEIVKTCCSYTNHTILKESLEEWNEQRLHYLIPRQCLIIEKLNMELCQTIREKYPQDEERVRRMSMIEGGQIRMAHLAIYGSHKINGVSELHTKILQKALFADFFALYPERFLAITNGISQRRWLLLSNPWLAQFVTERTGTGWITDLSHIAKLAPYAQDPESKNAFWDIKKKNKENLITYLREKHPLRDAKGKVLEHSCCLDPQALFDVHTKRIHEYKRQLMNVLHLIMIYHELKENPNARKTARMSIFSGKAAPGYDNAKYILQLIFCVARTVNNDQSTNHMLKIAFVENYNVSKAQIIIPAADLSEQISTAGLEASGTGNMKFALNGALTIGTEDGSTIEMRKAVTDTWWPFAFGGTAEQNALMHHEKSYNPWDIYMHNPKIRLAVDALRDRTFAVTEEEHNNLVQLYKSLLEVHNSDVLDRYFVLKDLESYYETQKRVEDLYMQKDKWAEYALHNMAAMGPFSADAVIDRYASEVWGLNPCPIDPKELAKVRAEYSDHDKCRLF